MTYFLTWMTLKYLSSKNVKKPNVNQSKTITERNLKDGIMFAIQKINDLEITSLLRYLELSIFFKEVTE